MNEKLKAIAKLCGYSNHERCTAHGRRAQGISLDANTNVGPGLMCQLGGHSSLKMVAKYHRPDQYAVDTAVLSKNDSPTKIIAALCCVNEDDSSYALLSQHAALDIIVPSLLVLLFWGRTNLR